MNMGISKHVCVGCTIVYYKCVCTPLWEAKVWTKGLWIQSAFRRLAAVLMRPAQCRRESVLFLSFHCCSGILFLQDILFLILFLHAPWIFFSPDSLHLRFDRLPPFKTVESCVRGLLWCWNFLIGVSLLLRSLRAWIEGEQTKWQYSFGQCFSHDFSILRYLCVLVEHKRLAEPVGELQAGLFSSG